MPTPQGLLLISFCLYSHLGQPVRKYLSLWVYLLGTFYINDWCSQLQYNVFIISRTFYLELVFFQRFFSDSVCMRRLSSPLPKYFALSAPLSCLHRASWLIRSDTMWLFQVFPEHAQTYVCGLSVCLSVRRYVCMWVDLYICLILKPHKPFIS